MADASALALRLIGLLELTSLEPTCGPAEIRGLCARAAGPPARVAAVCVWPQFGGEARRALKDTGVRVATVLRVPANSDVERVIEDAEEALGDGADEIEVTLPARLLQDGREGEAAGLVREVKGILPAHHALVVTVETHGPGGTAAVEAAVRLAVAAGADFVKLLQDRDSPALSPDAAGPVLAALAEAGRPVGLKVAPIAVPDEAVAWLAAAERAMGEGWASPQTFRLGANGLHAALAAAAPATASSSVPPSSRS